MKLSFLLPKNCIVTGLKSCGGTKKDMLAEMTDLVFEQTLFQDEGIGRDRLLGELLARENELTTAVGEGFAFPHARFPELKDYYLLLVLCREGVDFGSMDKMPVKIIILSIVSNSKASLLLQYRAAAMRFLMPEANRAAVLEAKSPEEVWNLLDESDTLVDMDITANDILIPQIGCLSPEMTLREAAIELHKFHTDSLPVVDLERNFLGDISCHDLFAFGLPRFFCKLRTISFMKHMDPFEKYFRIDGSVRIKSLLGRRPSPVISQDATLMEIIFEMTTNNRQILYVVKDGKLSGIIDRYGIIDKILIAG